MLARAGFTQVALSERGKSREKEMRNTKYFDPTPHIDFYMEGIK